MTVLLLFRIRGSGNSTLTVNQKWIKTRHCSSQSVRKAEGKERQVSKSGTYIYIYIGICHVIYVHVDQRCL